MKYIWISSICIWKTPIITWISPNYRWISPNYRWILVNYRWLSPDFLRNIQGFIWIATHYRCNSWFYTCIMQQFICVAINFTWNIQKYICIPSATTCVVAINFGVMSKVKRIWGRLNQKEKPYCKIGLWFNYSLGDVGFCFGVSVTSKPHRPSSFGFSLFKAFSTFLIWRTFTSSFSIFLSRSR